MPTGLAAVALLVVGLVALLPDCASACSCAMLPGSQQEQAERALNHSTAVFSGEVVEVEKPPPPTTMKMAMQSEATVTLRVSEVWKGPEQETLEVSTPQTDSRSRRHMAVTALSRNPIRGILLNLRKIVAVLAWGRILWGTPVGP
jgi:hypothetical protein